MTADFTLISAVADKLTVPTARSLVVIKRPPIIFNGRDGSEATRTGLNSYALRGVVMG